MASFVGRAPARVSLVGGGTDLPAFYERHGGAVVSFAIDVHAHAEAAARAEDLELVALDSGSRELIPTPAFARRVRPPILAEEFLVYQKAVAWHFGIERGRLAITSAIPAGAGLASSAAVCLAMIRAASALVGEEMDAAALAETAFTIEATVLRRPCGKQDQYASAFGGLNLIEFFRDGSVDVTPLRATVETMAVLGRRLMLFGNGARRSAAGPLQEQARRSASDADTVLALRRLKDMAYETRDVLESGDVDRVGTLLHEAWTAKQHLNSQVSSGEVARVYALGRSAGATGGKLAGAGGSGTLVLYCPEDAQDDVRRALSTQGWRERRWGFDLVGATFAEKMGAGDGLVRT